MTEIIKKPFNIREIQEEFPALHQEIYGKKLIYFDNGATSQKPQQSLKKHERKFNTLLIHKKQKKLFLRKEQLTE